ncbi:ARP [Symbiodinium natans]|uniref:ARP protein n=1 Tax=Symbiodinium natans TaxID=878477 RepID=A0A812KZR6_9DINO|nr:ARP [Symbiodinium natans]
MGESKLYRPSEVLVPTPSLVRCPAAMKFIRALPTDSWSVATGKRLARLGNNEDVAVEDARRLMSLHAEPLSAQKLRALLNSDVVKMELGRHCRSRNALGLTQLCELLGALLAAAQREPEKVPSFSDTGELPGSLTAECSLCVFDFCSGMQWVTSAKKTIRHQERKDCWMSWRRSSRCRSVVETSAVDLESC